MEFKAVLIGFILFSLIGFLMLNTIVEQGALYDKNTNEVLVGALDPQKFNNSITPVQEQGQEFLERFSKGTVWDIAGVVVTGIFGIALDMIALILVPFQLLSNILWDVLGVPPIVVSVIIGLFVIAIIFAIWELIKGGTSA